MVATGKDHSLKIAVNDWPGSLCMWCEGTRGSSFRPEVMRTKAAKVNRSDSCENPSAQFSASGNQSGCNKAEQLPLDSHLICISSRSVRKLIRKQESWQLPPDRRSSDLAHHSTSLDFHSPCIRAHDGRTSNILVNHVILENGRLEPVGKQTSANDGSLQIALPSLEHCWHLQQQYVRPNDIRQ